MPDSASDAELKPCPFCGCERVDVYSEDGDELAADRHVYVAQCWKCSARTNPVVGKAEAIGRWNTRAADRLASLSLQEGWRTIEIAPKDGRDLLCYLDGLGMGQMVLYWMDGYWREKADGRGLKRKPTHWMPLPSPPPPGASS